jgi:phage-related protein
MGVILTGPVAIVRPEERVNHVQIPGRAGDLTETEGADIYNSYIQTASIAVKTGARVREIYSWLRGSGYVTFSGEPDRKQQARVIGAITLNKHSRNLDWWEGEVQFYCQPFKELLWPKTETITASGSTVRNAGDVSCRPEWTVTVSGSGANKTVVLAAAGDGTPEENSINVTGLTGGSVIRIDAESMEVWNADGTQLLTKDSIGNFPVMARGADVITGSGWSSLTVDKRERFL